MTMSRERTDDLWFINKEAESLSSEHIKFSFGANWRKYVSNLDEAAIKDAENSFVAFTRFPRMDGHTFLDIGCGSGLNSLIAYRLGAKRVVSIDIDPNSIDCVTELRSKYAKGTNRWKILRGSVLDRSFIASLGIFSYVYSYGVLHHTGSMWQAVDTVTDCVEPGGKVHIALYNEHKHSARWLEIKRICNRWPKTVFPLLKVSFALFVFARLLARFQSPAAYVRRYRENRGMTFWRDVEDWLGGLPYEYCTPGEVVDFLSDRGFVLMRLRTEVSTGNNEFLFKLEKVSRRNE